MDCSVANRDEAFCRIPPQAQQNKRGSFFCINITVSLLMYFILEPIHQRFAISTSAKVACASIRFWLWEMSGLERTTPDIFHEFDRFTLGPAALLPDSVEAVIAIHRDGVSRMRSVYDHRIRGEREAVDNGLDHFARHLPEYCAVSASIAHHCRPQSSWLGSNLEAYSDILPLDQLDRLPGLLSRILGQEFPPLPVVHKTEKKSHISDEARHWFEQWTAHDTALGWDGKTLRIFDQPDSPVTK